MKASASDRWKTRCFRGGSVPKARWMTSTPLTGTCRRLRPGEKETDPQVHPFEKRQPVPVTLGE